MKTTKNNECRPFSKILLIIIIVCSDNATIAIAKSIYSESHIRLTTS